MSDAREGPKFLLKISCNGCKYSKSEKYAVQGDSGFQVYCSHPLTKMVYVGDSNWNTPQWCPLLQTATEAFIKELKPNEG